MGRRNQIGISFFVPCYFWFSAWRAVNATIVEEVFVCECDNDANWIIVVYVVRSVSNATLLSTHHSKSVHTPLGARHIRIINLFAMFTQLYQKNQMCTAWSTLTRINDASTAAAVGGGEWEGAKNTHARIGIISITIIVIITISNHYNVLGGIPSTERVQYVFHTSADAANAVPSPFWEGFGESVLLLRLSAVKPTRSLVHTTITSDSRVLQIKCSMYSLAWWSIDYTYTRKGVEWMERGDKNRRRKIAEISLLKFT